VISEFSVIVVGNPSASKICKNEMAAMLLNTRPDVVAGTSRKSISNVAAPGFAKSWNEPDTLSVSPVKTTGAVFVVRNDLQYTNPEMVIVEMGKPGPELTSNTTSSADVGTPAPPEPPEVADQLVVAEASQVPLPPTQ
jgi:hypothetical protein